MSTAGKKSKTNLGHHPRRNTLDQDSRLSISNLHKNLSLTNLSNSMHSHKKHVESATQKNNGLRLQEKLLKVMMEQNK